VKVLHVMEDPFLPAWARRPDEAPSTLTWPLSCFVRYADRTKFEVAVCSLTDSAEGVREIPGASQYLSLGCRGRRDWPRAIVRLARWLQRERVDVVHTHLLDATAVGLAAAQLAGVPMRMLTGHHSAELAYQRRGTAFHVDMFLLSQLAHLVVAPCRFMRDVFVRVYRLRPERLPVIEHGLDRARLVYSAAGGARVRAELGLQGKTVLGTLGRFSWVKHHDSLLRAFATVAAGNPDLVLAIVGAGPEREGVLNMARELGVADRLVLAGTRSDIPDFMSAIDAYVHSSVTESFGLALLEALAAGKPALSTDVGIAPDIVEEGRTGVLVPAGEPAALTAGLQRLLGLRAQWKSMGEEAERRARAYSAERMVERYEARYLEWLSTSPRQPHPA
jgi:L-malate glycosyltransferase